MQYRCPKCSSHEVKYDEIKCGKNWSGLAGLVCVCGHTTGYFKTPDQLSVASKEWLIDKNSS